MSIGSAVRMLSAVNGRCLTVDGRLGNPDDFPEAQLDHSIPQFAQIKSPPHPRVFFRPGVKHTPKSHSLINTLQLANHLKSDVGSLALSNQVIRSLRLDYLHRSYVISRGYPVLLVPEIHSQDHFQLCM